MNEPEEFSELFSKFSEEFDIHFKNTFTNRHRRSKPEPEETFSLPPNFTDFVPNFQELFGFSGKSDATDDSKKIDECFKKQEDPEPKPPEYTIVSLDDAATEVIYRRNPLVRIHECQVLNQDPILVSNDYASEQAIYGELKRTVQQIKRENPICRPIIVHMWTDAEDKPWKLPKQKIEERIADFHHATICELAGNLSCASWYIDNAIAQERKKERRKPPISGLPSLDDVISDELKTPPKKFHPPVTKYYLIALDAKAARIIEEMNPLARLKKVPILTDYHWKWVLDFKVRNKVEPAAQGLRYGSYDQIAFCHSFQYGGSPWKKVATSIAQHCDTITRKLVLYVGPGMRPYAEDIIKRAK